MTGCMLARNDTTVHHLYTTVWLVSTFAMYTKSTNAHIATYLPAKVLVSAEWLKRAIIIRAAPSSWMMIYKQFCQYRDWKTRWAYLHIPVEQEWSRRLRHQKTIGRTQKSLIGYWWTFSFGESFLESPLRPKKEFKKWWIFPSNNIKHFWQKKRRRSVEFFLNIESF